MKKCINCKCFVRESDTFCRNCGCMLHSDRQYIYINVLTIFVIIGIFFMIALFIASYLINK